MPAIRELAEDCLVSVIIPARNEEEHIERSLRSVLTQTYQHIEVVLVDDGSTDRTVEVALSLGDERVRIVPGSGQGVSSARNIGVRASLGSYIMFVDADDELTSNSVAQAVSLISQNDSDLIIGGAERVQPNGLSSEFLIDADGPVFYRENRINALIEMTVGYSSDIDPRLNSCLLSACWARLIKRKLLKGLLFDESIPIGEDTVFNVALLKKCHEVIVVPQLWYRYHQNSSSATHRFRLNAFEEGSALVEALVKELGYGSTWNSLRRRALFQLELAVRQRIAPGCPEETMRAKARALRAELQEGYWASFLDDSSAIGGLGVKHRGFLLLARHRMASALSIYCWLYYGMKS